MESRRGALRGIVIRRFLGYCSIRDTVDDVSLAVTWETVEKRRYRDNNFVVPARKILFPSEKYRSNNGRRTEVEGEF